MLAAFTELYNQAVIAAAVAAQGITTVADIAARNAFYATPANQSKLVYVNNNNGAADDPANGVYEYVDGAPRLAEAFYAGITALVQPLVDEAVSAKDAAEAAAVEATATVANTWLTSTDVLDQMVPDVNPAGDAAATAGTSWGITIPDGEIGNLSNVQIQYGIDGAARAGDIEQYEIEVTTSPVFTPPLAAQLIASTTGTPTGVARTISTPVVTVDGDKRTYAFEYEVQSEDRQLWPYIIVSNASPVAGDQTFEVTKFSRRVKTAADSVSTFQDRMFEERFAQSLARRLGRPAYDHIIIVDLDGGGDFTHPKVAIDAITALRATGPATATNRYAIVIRPGFYFGYGEWHCKNWVDLIGIDPERCNIHHELGSPTGVASTSLMWLETNTLLYGLKLTVKNCQYVIHLETNGNPQFENTHQQIVNCHVEHLGNAGIGNVGWAIANQFAVGAGISSGQRITLRNSVFIGPAGGFSYHTNAEFDLPTFVDSEGCTYVPTSTEWNAPFSDSGYAALRIIPAGSGQADQCRLVGNSFGGPVLYGVNNGAGWLSIDPNYQPADHSEIRVYGYGNSNLLFKANGQGLALRIRSNSTGASSSVAVAGDLWGLFGDPAIVTGTTGLPGSATFPRDISGEAVGPSGSGGDINSLKVRLGNRTGAPISGTVAVDGGSAQTVTLGGNYTGQDNATIIAAIQAQITGATVTEHSLDKEYFPELTDEVARVRNDGATGYPKGTTLAWDTRVGESVRVMTDADAARRFAGVLLEDLVPGGTARVKSKGMLMLDRLLTSGGISLALGDPLSVSATPGALAESASKPVAYAAASDTVELV